MLYERLYELATQTERVHHYLSSIDNYVTRTYAELYTEADSVAGHLQKEGVTSGDKVALVILEPDHFISSFVAIVLAGGIPIPLSPPSVSGRTEAYYKLLNYILEDSHATYLLHSDDLEDLNETHFSSVRCLDITEIHGNNYIPHTPITHKPTDIAFLQYTSGSTGHPKGVVVTYENLDANTTAIQKAIALDPSSDTAVCWLPMYHDMGLIGKVLTPLCFPTDIVFISTRRFIRSPMLWLKAITHFNATITFSPNFALALMVKRYRADNSLALQSLRLIGCGAEPVNAATLDAFYQCYKPHGLSESALTPCYGMAEATLAISFGNTAENFKNLCIDRQAYYTEKVARPVLANSEPNTPSMIVTSCGKIISGHNVKVVKKDGGSADEMEIGEIYFSGPSVTEGYFEKETTNKQHIFDSWLHTGDLGFISKGELYISGRVKDVIIINGRNIYPQDIEWELDHLDALRMGNHVAISVNEQDTEALIVICEAKRPNLTLKKQIEALCSNSVGVYPHDIIFIRPGTLPKTTSGKVRRSESRNRYLNKQLDIIKTTEEYI